jgi:hypothetical protein
MTRSPLFYPLNRGLDGDAGGVSDLQTDVMRFMAILALCLVAIFALVQSIPLAPSVEPPAPVDEVIETPEASPQIESPQIPAAKTVVEREIKLTRAQPKKLPPKEAQPVLQRPRAASIEKVEPRPVTEEPPREGFTLRFEDEVALTRLVARNEVGLYAILPGSSFRMNVNRGQFSFWPASMPNRFHEMDETTVPATVTEAFRRSSAARTQGLKWGVTIPSATSQRLEQYLREETGGNLVIDAQGELRLER